MQVTRSRWAGLTNFSRYEVYTFMSLQETRVYQEARADEAKLLVLRQLIRRVGEVAEPTKVQIESLSLEQLEALGETLLDFVDRSDLAA